MFQNITPITRNLIIINAILFVVSHYIFPHLIYMLSAFIPLSPNFKSWQIITHMFMHGSVMHLAFNMLTLWSFGPVLEKVLGERKFIIFYLVCGLGSFIIYNLWNYYQVYELTKTLTQQGVNIGELYLKSDLNYRGSSSVELPDRVDGAIVREFFNYLRTPMLGASGAIFSVVAAFSTLFPNATMMFMFIPFPIKAKYLFPLIILGSLYLGIRQQEGDNVAHFAHIGGALIGWIWIQNWKKNQDRIA